MRRPPLLSCLCHGSFGPANPEGFAGPNDPWHKHDSNGGLRMKGGVVVGAESTTEAQSAYTVDLSEDGARLDGIGFLTSPGQTIEVRRLWRKARFRVVWIGHVGTTESNQAGVVLQSEKNIWRIE